MGRAEYGEITLTFFKKMILFLLTYHTMCGII